MSTGSSAVNGGGRNRYVYFAATVCAIGGLLFGFDTGIISGALLFIRKDLALSPFLQSAMVSAVLVGAVLAVIMLIGMLPIPDTLRWLSEQGRQDEARAVLERSRNSDEEVERDLRGKTVVTEEAEEPSPS